ncbi:F-box family protein [Trifolium medium]|uniref:F-box family protein n=1 Tax=Trifolium medium TaxID=97028 RepID=A0A392N8Q5_9FABA|nr:F-box family protein [Trifolium medium]
MCVSNSPTEFRSIDFEAFLNYDPHPASFNINIWFPQTDYTVKIKGSCRGFILLFRRPDIFYIWNPSTGFKKQIPLSPFDSKVVEFLFSHLYGFGYDQSRDDYLVVVLSHEPTEENPFTSHLEIFSNRDNRWKEIEGTHFPYFGDQEGLLFNGAIHWLALRPDLDIYVIVAFDLMERKLFEMPLPDDFHQELVSMASGLWVFGEFLGLWGKHYDNTVEIWVMKEYTLNSSWTKTFVLPRNSIPNYYFSPICSTNNGDIIGTMCGTCLVKLNDKGQPLRHRSFRNSLSNIVMYTESLLSLPGDNDQVYKLEE